MGKLLAFAGAMLAYFCVATVLSAVAVAAYVRLAGVVDDTKLTKLWAVIEGLDLEAMRQAAELARQPVAPAQPSLDEMARARAAKSRDLELREQSLRNVLDQVRDERSKLAEATDRYRRVKTTLDGELKALYESALATNQENARLILENLKPRQAKEQVLLMVDSGAMPAAVVLLSTMPISKRAKILGEFKTDEEQQKLAEILKLIREGEPELSLIDKARKQVGNASDPSVGG